MITERQIEAGAEALAHALSGDFLDLDEEFTPEDLREVAKYVLEAAQAAEQ